MKTRLKLYVFTDFCPDYTSGLAVAIASSEARAKKQIEAKCGFGVMEWGKLTVHRIDRRMAESVLGGG